MGLLKMDFLGLSTLTLIDDALKEIKRTTGETLDIDAIPMDDAEDLRAVCRRADRRRLPVRVVGHARGAAQGQAVTLRRPDRPQRAVPAGPARRRRRRQLREPSPRARADHVHGAADGADPQRHLRGDRLPGTGHARRARRRRLHDGRGRRAAQGHGQEGPQGHGGAARSVRARAPSRTSCRRRRPARSSTCWRTSPATASTSRTRRRTRCSRTRPGTSRPTTRATSWRRC